MGQKTHTYPDTEKITTGSNVTVWMDSVQPLAFQELKEDLETDVVIVGGGISGVSIAYCLVKSGKKVVIIEDGFIGSGETGRTTAHLVSAIDDRYYNLERLYGEEKTRLIAGSHIEAINFIEQTILKEKINCDFERVDGYLFLHPSDDPESLMKEYQAAEKAGVAVEKLGAMPGLENYYGPCLKFSSQGQFHPLKYLVALCDVIQKHGATIYTNTRAKKIDHTGIVTNTGFKINAKHVVVATNSPVKGKMKMHLKQYAYRTYVIGAKIKKGSLPRSLWWDTGNFSANKDIPPYHYVRVQKLDEAQDLLLIGGEDHPIGLADIENRPEEERYALLETWANEYFDLGDIIYKWSGQVMEPIDGIAYIGRNPADKNNNVYVVSGDSGDGMTYAAIAATLIDDLINERKNKLEELYHPGRHALTTAGKSLFKELVGGFANYFKVKEKDFPDNELQTIKKNEGKIIELEGKKYGVFCDETDQLHFVSAECTHLKCTVKWNNDERSWDCPCHGSRFTYEGKIVNGPANIDLLYHKEIKPSASGTIIISTY